MKYNFVIVTHEGPSLLTGEEFESWVNLLMEDGEICGITELLDELPFDYEKLEPHQAAFMALDTVCVNLANGGWRR